MARHNKTLPARRQTTTNDSLLIRSAESLGRVIGSLQRQLDAARHLTGRATSAEFIADGHRSMRQRDLTTEAKTQRKTKSARPSDASRTRAASDRKSKRAARPAAKKTSTRRRSATKRRA
jgi:hypothetical protein